MRNTVLNKVKKLSHAFFDGPAHKLISLLPTQTGVTLADVGAAGDIQPRWKAFSGLVNYIGFEPDERSRESLSKTGTSFKSHTVLPHALAEAQKTSLLYLCRKPETSSLLIPNSEFLGRFPDSERFDVVDTANVDCVALDSLQITKVDFLKIDIQGAENDVLKGASSTLEKVLGVEIEVEFLDLYQGQPLFGEVCKTLAEAGFEFIDFVNLQRWERSALGSHGQCVFGDALFLKTPEKILATKPDIDALSTYISILAVYRRLDLIDTVLDLLPEGIQPSFQPFELFFARVKRREAGIRKLHSYLNQIFSLLGSETRLHLMR